MPSVPWHGVRFVVLALLSFASLAAAVTSVQVSYCANFNTASTAANFSIYQSDGLCFGFCKDSYAYAIVQGGNCWCSDYTPASSVQVDNAKCNAQCPGYPDDLCGAPGLWGYMIGAKKPTGTKGGGESGTGPLPATTAIPGIVTQTVQNTVTLDNPAPSEKTSSTYESASSTDIATQPPAAPSTFVSTVTQGGSVVLQTVTVMPTATGTGNTGANTANVNTESKGLSTGAAVGTAVGVFGGVIIAGVVGGLLWIRRRKRNQAETTSLEHQNSFRGSSAGMMSTPRTEMASVWEGEGSTGRRNSRLMPHDPRMDPYTTNIYGRFENKSHESINTLRDDQDYSRRVLRTTNPDPTA